MPLTWKTMNELCLEFLDGPGNLPPPPEKRPWGGKYWCPGSPGQAHSQAIQATDSTGKRGHRVLLFAGDKGFDRK